MTCFRIGQPKLPGDYYAAMYHKVTAGTPKGFTPLHVLCQDSDKMLCKRDIIADVLGTNLVKLRDFDANKNDQVIVLVFYLLWPIIPMRCGFPFRGRIAGMVVGGWMLVGVGGWV